MKRRILSMSVMFLFAGAALVIAHPPTEMTFVYDIEKQQAVIETKHLTDDPDEDYLRKMIFFRNGEEFKTEYFQRQTDRLYFNVEIPLEAEEGDTLEVKVISAEGGSKTASLTVEKAPIEGEETTAGMKDMKASTDAVAATPSSKPAKKSSGYGSKKGSGY